MPHPIGNLGCYETAEYRQISDSRSYHNEAMLFIGDGRGHQGRELVSNNTFKSLCHDIQNKDRPIIGYIRTVTGFVNQHY